MDDDKNIMLKHCAKYNVMQKSRGNRFNFKEELEKVIKSRRVSEHLNNLPNKALLRIIKDKKCYIYLATCTHPSLFTGYCYVGIGFAKDPSLTSFIGSSEGELIDYVVDSLGRESFKREIIEEFDNEYRPKFIIWAFLNQKITIANSANHFNIEGSDAKWKREFVSEVPITLHIRRDLGKDLELYFEVCQLINNGLLPKI